MTGVSTHRSIARVAAGIIFVLALLALFASACSASGPTTAATPPAAGSTAVTQRNNGVSTSAATQTSEGGQVTVVVTWQANQRQPVFKVALDTHSVNLDSVDLAQTAILRTDQGIEVRSSGWDAPKGGHHRSGTLVFPATTLDGTPVLGENARLMELLIRDVAGVPERRFEWTL